MHPRLKSSPGTSPASVHFSPSGQQSITHQDPRSARIVYFVEDLADPSFGTQETLSSEDSPNNDPSSTARVDHVRLMTGSDKSRARKMSRSSEEREMSLDVKSHPKDGSVDPEPDSRGIKRKYTNEVLDYPRRRATIAVRNLEIAAVERKVTSHTAYATF